MKCIHPNCRRDNRPHHMFNYSTWCVAAEADRQQTFTLDEDVHVAVRTAFGTLLWACAFISNLK